MHIIRGYKEIPNAVKGAAIAIGNFDGLHLGHQDIIEKVRMIAQKDGVPAGVMSFEPHPRQYFAKKMTGRAAAPMRIISLHKKLRLLADLGLDATFLMRFTETFAALTAEQFIEQVLVDALAISHVVTGQHFIFGHQRGGNADLLKRYAEQGAFTYDPVSEVGFQSSVVSRQSSENSGEVNVRMRDLETREVPLLRGSEASRRSPLGESVANGSKPCRSMAETTQIISSTRIRNALAEGDVALAGQLLGRDYKVIGRVIHGDALGRTLGFPTANIKLPLLHTPRYGVYVVEFRRFGAEGHWQHGIANLGLRPTVRKAGGSETPLLEVHGFDMDENLYGERLEVAFLHPIRPEQRFDGVDALKAQIEKDCEVAREWLERVD